MPGSFSSRTLVTAALVLVGSSLSLCACRARHRGDASATESDAGAIVRVVTSPRATWVDLVDRQGVHSSAWTAGDRLVVTAADRLWMLDPKAPDRADVVSLPGHASLQSDPARDTYLVTMETKLGAHLGIVHLYRGLERIRTFRDVVPEWDRFGGGVVAADGKHVVLYTGSGEHPTVRFGDVETGNLHPPVPGYFATTDATGRYAMAGGAVYDLLTGAKVAEPRPHAGSSPLAQLDSEPMIGSTAFFFASGGVDAWDALSDTTKWVSLACPRGREPFDAVDAPHARTVRVCGTRVYVASWPGGSVRRFELPLPLLHPSHAEARAGADDTFELRVTDATFALDARTGAPRRIEEWPPYREPSGSGTLLLRDYPYGVAVLDRATRKERMHFGAAAEQDPTPRTSWCLFEPSDSATPGVARHAPSGSCALASP